MRCNVLEASAQRNISLYMLSINLELLFLFVRVCTAVQVHRSRASALGPIVPRPSVSLTAKPVHRVSPSTVTVVEGGGMAISTTRVVVDAFKCQRARETKEQPLYI